MSVWNKIEVDTEHENYRLDKFLTESGICNSRSIASKLCEDSNVKVNGDIANKKQCLFYGDIVEYVEQKNYESLKAQNIPLNIKYEDDHIIVLSKQPGLVCHPAKGHNNNTLVNALIYHCGKDNLCNIQDNQKRLGIVHRLDGDTSGLIICAKTDTAGLILQDAMKEHSTSRHYKALVYGNVKYNTGKIDVPLLRIVNKRPKIVASDSPKAKYAITTFEVLDRICTGIGEFSLLDCKIHTGRTHQIRSHMEYIGHSIVGDSLYNNGIIDYQDIPRQIGLKRQFLHSYKIGFEHPITQKYLLFEDELWPDLQDSLFRLKSM